MSVYFTKDVQLRDQPLLQWSKVRSAQPNLFPARSKLLPNKTCPKGTWKPLQSSVACFSRSLLLCCKRQHGDKLRSVQAPTLLAMLAVCTPDRSVTVLDYQGKELLRGPGERISSPGAAKHAPVALAWHNHVLVIAWADETLTFVVFHTNGKVHYTKVVPPLKGREAATPVLLRWLRYHGSGSGDRLLVANEHGRFDILAMMSNSTLEVDWEPERVCPLPLQGALCAHG
jgi:hypothetical protein